MMTSKYYCMINEHETIVEGAINEILSVYDNETNDIKFNAVLKALKEMYIQFPFTIKMRKTDENCAEYYYEEKYSKYSAKWNCFITETEVTVIGKCRDYRSSI